MQCPSARAQPRFLAPPAPREAPLRAAQLPTPEYQPGCCCVPICGWAGVASAHVALEMSTKQMATWLNRRSPKADERPCAISTAPGLISRTEPLLTVWLQHPGCYRGRTDTLRITDVAEVADGDVHPRSDAGHGSRGPPATKRAHAFDMARGRRYHSASLPRDGPARAIGAGPWDPRRQVDTTDAMIHNGRSRPPDEEPPQRVAVGGTLTIEEWQEIRKDNVRAVKPCDVSHGASRAYFIRRV